MCIWVAICSAITFIVIISSLPKKEPCIGINSAVFPECTYFKKELIQDINRVKRLRTFEFETKPSTSLVTLFTSFDVRLENQFVYSNMVKNWASLGSGIKPVLYSNGEVENSMLGSSKWEVHPVPFMRCGSPVLRNLFQKTMSLYNSTLYGYANADILFNDALSKTLAEVVKSDLFKKGPILITGRRLEFNMSAAGVAHIDSFKLVEKLAKKTTLSHGMAGDILITNKLFLWNHVPDLAIGREIIDNWLIWYARAIGAKVIDITGTVIALHQTTKSRKKKYSNCNIDLTRKLHILPSIPIWRGSIDCADYVTHFTSTGDVQIIKKRELIPTCSYSKVRFWM